MKKYRILRYIDVPYDTVYSDLRPSLGSKRIQYFEPITEEELKKMYKDAIEGEKWKDTSLDFNTFLKSLLDEGLLITNNIEGSCISEICKWRLFYAKEEHRVITKEEIEEVCNRYSLDAKKIPII